MTGRLSATEYARLVDQAAGAPEPAPLATIHLLRGDAIETPGQLVERLLLAQDITMLTGPGGAAKSVIALGIAVSVILGDAAFGVRTVRRRGRVLYLAPEDGAADVRQRMEALIRGHGLEGRRAELEDGLIYVEDGEPFSLVTDAGRLQRTVQDHDAVLVVADPLRNLIGSSAEEDNSIAGAALDNLRRRVCREAGAGLLITHHVRKRGRGEDGGQVTADDVRGAGAWVAGSRLVFTVAKQGDVVTLSAVKSNRLRPADLYLRVRLTIEADPADASKWHRLTLEDADAAVGSLAYTPGLARALTDNELAALVALDDRHEPGLRLSWSQWKARSGTKDDTFDKLKRRLVDAGLVDSEQTGRSTPAGRPVFDYGLTTKGRSLLPAMGIAA